jgi:hypothetical protein
MPDNGLAPPNMPWLWQPNSPVGQPNGLGPPMLNYAAPPPDTSQGAGVAAAGQQAWQWLQDQRAESTRQGLLDPDTGLPTQVGAVDAAQKYGSALLMGSTAPSIRAFHGSLDDFDAFDAAKVGSGAMADRWAPGTSHADEYYLTTDRQHAAHYGDNVHEFQIDAPLLQKDAKAELEAWAKDQGYDNAQQHINDYYDGSVYDALDADNYYKDALSEAKKAGFPGVHVSFGDLKDRLGDRMVPMGDTIILHDPSVAVKPKPR